MKIEIEIPDELCKSGWLSDIVDEGSECAWCSNDTTGLGGPSKLLYTLAFMLQELTPIPDQQAKIDAMVEEIKQDCPEDLEPYVEPTPVDSGGIGMKSINSDYSDEELKTIMDLLVGEN